MSIHTRRLLAAFAATWLAVSNAPAGAQALGNRPIRIITPYSTGGPVDVASRLIAESMSPILGVPVEYR